MPSGLFLYSGFNATKKAVTQIFRTADPAACGPTTSTLPTDVPISAGIAQSCAQSSYVNANGVATASFVNFLYDARSQAWYKAAKTTGQARFNPVSLSISGTYVVPYSTPLLNSSGSFAGVYGVDISLDDIEASVNAVKSANTVSYVTVASTNQLLSTSVGEAKTALSGGNVVLRTAAQSSNFIIRESAAFLLNKGITSDGFYTYTGSDGNSYVLQLKSFTDPSTQTATWNIVVVSLVTTTPIAASTSLSNTLTSLSQDLSAYLNDSISAAQYLAFYAGEGAHSPLSSPLISLSSTSWAFVGSMQQTLWGVVNNIPGLTSVR